MRRSEHQQTPYERNVDVTQRVRHGAQSDYTTGLRRGIQASKQVFFGNGLRKPLQIARTTSGS